jgi:hypothetical protein
MRYARTENDTVVEIIESEDIDKRFHPDFIKSLMKVKNDVDVGMVNLDGKFVDPSTIKPSIDEIRKTMNLSAADARIRLAKSGLLLRVIETINAMPDDSILKIKWEYETTFKRLDPTLVDFCNETLGMDDEKIDALFM